MNDRSEITWAPRVTLREIRELYEREARGDCDDDFLEEVGFGLYSRCLSIIEYTEACEGRVRCKRCLRNTVDTFIERKTGKPDELIRCPVCGWQVRWKVYMAESEKVDGQLHGSNAINAFRTYAARYPNCKTREDKILAIDHLIHEFHWILMAGDEGATGWKPAGVNLLRGTATQVIDLLNELTYGENTPPELIEERERWRAQKSIVRRTKNA